MLCKGVCNVMTGRCVCVLCVCVFVHHCVIYMIRGSNVIFMSFHYSPVEFPVDIPIAVPSSKILLSCCEI